MGAVQVKSQKSVSAKTRTSSALPIPVFPSEPSIEVKTPDVTLERTYTRGLMTEGEVTFFLKPASIAVDATDHVPEE
jgi:hypothetical protein